MRSLLVSLAAAGLLLLPLSGQAESWDNWRYAVKSHSDAEVVRMLDAGQDINAQNEEGWTALHVAADDGNERMVRYLLARGARTDLKTNRGRTAYDVAESYPAIRAAIREKMAPAADPFSPYLGGAKPAPARPAAPAPAAQPAPRPAPPAARPAAASGACALVNAAPANDGRTNAARPRLQARDAVWYNKPAELTALLDDCVGLDSKDSGGSTLLHVAVERNRVDIARLLIARGASRDVTDKAGKRPADYATSPEMVALVGASSPAPKPQQPSGTKNEAFCKQMWNEAQVLCGSGSSALMCRTSASVRYSSCLQKGTWY